jgi:WD40 repeat protein
MRGTRILVRTTDNMVEVWDSSLTSRIRAIPVEASDVWAPVADSAGDVIAQSRADSTVRLIDVDSGTELVTFRATSSSSLRVGIGFSPDGTTTIITATDPKRGEYGVTGDGTLVSRSIAPDALTRTA